MNKKLFAISVVLTLLLTACGSNIQKKIDELASDGTITKQELISLQKESTNQEQYAKFKDISELHKFVLKYLKTKKIDANVWNPSFKNITPFNVNVYFENSYSMDGYIFQADLKSSIYNLLINTRQFAKAIKLNYINSEVIPAPTADIKSFSADLTNDTFQKLGGKRGVSDIAEVLQRILSRTDTTNASILISDFVFSPPKNKNALSYLSMQEVAIKDAFLGQLKKQPVAVAIFQMKANFQGYYYDHLSNSIALSNIKRPYYIWYIGTPQQVKLALSKQIISNDNEHLINKLIIHKNDVASNPKYKVVNKGKIGDFKFSKFNEIIGAESLNGEFGFSLAVNFAESLKDLDYFSNSRIYKANGEYEVSSRRLNEKEQSLSAYSEYTHLLTLKTSKFQTGEVQIKVFDQLAPWVASSSSIDDSKIGGDSSEQARTFGLNYLIRGVAQAFSSEGQSSLISELKVKIKE